MMARQLGLDLEAAPKIPATLSSFHVRSAMPLAEALGGEKRAVTQEAILLAWFRAHPGKRFAPSEVQAVFHVWPITSVRRAMTGLAKRGDLVHHENDRRPGPYGSAESRWGLA